MQENKVKKYKILGDSFKQYIAVSKNTFSETKTNKITEKNVEEIISSFEKSNVEIFVYMGHKEEEERVAIGKVLKLEKDNEAIGIYATIEWFDESITEKKSFYPSIEMVGKKLKKMMSLFIGRIVRLRLLLLLNILLVRVLIYYVRAGLLKLMKII